MKYEVSKTRLSTGNNIVVFQSHLQIVFEMGKFLFVVLFIALLLNDLVAAQTSSGGGSGPGSGSSGNGSGGGTGSGSGTGGVGSSTGSGSSGTGSGSSGGGNGALPVAMGSGQWVMLSLLPLVFMLMK